MTYPPNPGSWNPGPGQSPQQPPAQAPGQQFPGQQFPQQQYPQQQPYSQPGAQPPQQYPQTQPQQPQQWAQQTAQPQGYRPPGAQPPAATGPKKGPARAIVAIVLSAAAAVFLYTASAKGLGSLDILRSNPFADFPKWVGLGVVASALAFAGFVISILAFRKRRPKIMASIAVVLAILFPLSASLVGINVGLTHVGDHMVEVSEMGPEVLDNMIEQMKADGHDVTILETIREELENRGLIAPADS